MRQYKFIINSQPIAKQSARFSNGVTYQPAKIKNIFADYKSQILAQIPEHFEIIESPVAVKIEFSYLPLKGFKKKQLEKLKEKGFLYKPTRPDLDNLEKMAMDCLNGTVVKDDSQIVRKESFKLYGDKNQISITIEVLEDE